MSVSSFNDLKHHFGHNIVTALYGPKENPVNVAIECETCNEVLLDFDRPVPARPKSLARCRARKSSAKARSTR
jgi:hypothetical protein